MKDLGRWVSKSLFIGAFCASCGTGEAARLDADATVAASREALLADGSLKQVGEVVSNTTYEIVSGAAITSARFATAGKLSTGRMGVILWRLEDDGRVTNLANLTSLTSLSTKVSLARVDDHSFIVASKNSAGNYTVTAFRIDPTTNALTQTDEEVRGTVSDIAITSMNPVPGDIDIAGPSGARREGHVVVVHRASNDALGLSDYSLTASGALRLNGTAAAGAVQRVAIATVPGGRPPASILSQSSACAAPDETWCSPEKALCSNGKDDDEDGFRDCDDWDCCGEAACAGSATCTQGTVVTASTSASNTMKLVAWQIGATGAITRLGDATVGAAVSFDISAQSFRRVATVSTTGGAPQFASWDVDSAGSISLVPSAYSPARSATDVRLINGSGARLFWMFSDSTGAGYLQTMEGIDSPRALERIRLADTFWSKPGDLVSLGNDRLVLVNSNASNKLMMRVFRDYNQPLIQSDSGPYGGLASGPDPGFGFTIKGPFGGPQDNQIAVSPSYLLACGNSIAIYDKAGKLLKEVSATTLYTSSLRRKLDAHLPYQFACDASQPGSTSDNTNRCLNMFFDGRCAYDATTDRFVVTSTMRWSLNGKVKDRSQRMMAIAVSKSGDPRAGFQTYATTDNKYDDNPVLATAGGTAILSFRWTDNDLADTFPEESLRPSVLLFDIAAMSAGSSQGVTTKLAQWQTGGRRMLNVAGSGGPLGLGVVYSEVNGVGLDLYAFQQYARGEIPVFASRVTVPNPGYVTHNGFVQMCKAQAANPSQCDGHLYVPDLFTGSTGSQGIRVRDVSLSATLSGSRVTALSASLAGSKDLPWCGKAGDLDNCILPAIVATDQKVVTLFGQYTRLSACTQCASGLCDANGLCAVAPLFPSIRAERWTVPIASAIFQAPFNFITGPSPDLELAQRADPDANPPTPDIYFDGWRVNPSVLDRSSAVLDSDGHDVFGIHSTTADTCTPQTSCGGYDDMIVRFND